MLQIIQARTFRRAARVVIACSMVMAAAQGASAEEGIGGFLSSIFGGSPSVPVSAPRSDHASPPPVDHIVGRDFAPRGHRALTVRLRPRSRYTFVTQLPTKPAKVSIYEDKTLRAGDSVMTERGIRVFAGSNSWPYRPGDFLRLGDARDMNAGTEKTLAELDRRPQG